MKQLPTWLGLGIGVMIGAYLLLLGTHNAGPVTLDLIVHTFELPLYGVVGGFFFAGILAGGAALGGLLIAQLRTRRQLRLQLEGAQRELRQLRNAPLEEAAAPAQEEPA